MIEELIDFIESLKRNPTVQSFDEASTKQAIILPILHLLGWNTHNIDEVTPEFSVENKRVDYSLRLNKTNEFFIEVKKTGVDLENYEEQLLDYSFRQGVELATLTNGITGWFYLPTKKGDWRARKFYTIDIIQQESNDVASKFIDLLSKGTVQSGKAIQHAESIYKGRLKRKTIEDTLPEVWNKIITETDSLLIDLIAERTEKVCGFKTEAKDVEKFLVKHEAKFLVSPELFDGKVEGKKQHRPKRPKGAKLSQDDLIPYIVEVLRKHGGRARKDEVDRELYERFQATFQQAWYQELVAQGIPRWQHNIAWAKERAKRKGLIKSAEESGRGYWELTATDIR